MPDILSPAELNELRGLVRDLAMPGTAMVLRGTTASNGAGGYTSTFGTASFGGTTFIPCRFRPSSNNERMQAGVVTGITSWTVILPAEWPITQADRVVLLPMHIVLAVQGVLAPQSWELQRRLVCSEQR